jgi:hypothetical protein
MTESISTPPAAAPLHYAVLVARDGAAEQSWAVLYANGDLASARSKAEEWVIANPGQRAVVVQYVDHVQLVSAAKWAKP